ncbi:MAG TPA: alpha/beta hydrolase, partial [Kofleriaceae bacterium]|nr:alpha/beta hydrolase [Kofleriaceae bacterium]
ALDNVAISGNSISFALTKFGAVLKGTIDGDTIKGTLEQGGQTIPFKLARGGGYKPPPPPRKPLTASAGAKLLGTWKGKIGDSDITVELHDENGLVAGTMLAQRACKPTKLDNLTLTFKTVHAEMQGTSGVDGTLSDDTISGTAHRSGGDEPWSLKREPVAAADKPYIETQLTIPSTNGTTLAATLTTPKGPPAPVVVTITGSGPQDRDECVVGIRPFAQLADHLARHGIATLRYDDRGTARSTGDFATATAADFADDAQAAVTFLATRTDIDPKKIGLLGHSEGGLIAPIVAARDKDVAFVVMWAGPGVPLDQVIIRQTGEGLKAEGTPKDKVDHALKVQQALWQLRHANKDRDKFKAAFIAASKRLLDKTELAEIKDIDAWAESEISQIWNPWFTWYLDYDPKVTLRKLTQPVLAINGGLDKQVDPTINLPAIKAALAKNKDVSIVEIPGQNHVFQPTKTGAVSEYTKNPTVMDNAVLDTTTAWIRKHTGLE